MDIVENLSFNGLNEKEKKQGYRLIYDMDSNNRIRMFNSNKFIGVKCNNCGKQLDYKVQIPFDDKLNEVKEACVLYKSLDIATNHVCFQHKTINDISDIVTEWYYKLWQHNQTHNLPNLLNDVMQEMLDKNFIDEKLLKSIYNQMK